MENFLLSVVEDESGGPSPGLAGINRLTDET